MLRFASRLLSPHHLTAPLLGLLLNLSCHNANAAQLQIDIEIPALAVTPYHRPYIAAWLETTNRRGVKTLAVWYEDGEWLRDLRQWWRRLGRTGVDSGAFDQVTGATRQPGHWPVQLDTSQLPPGDYLLCIEAVREEGGRELLRQPITLTDRNDQPQLWQLQGRSELGHIAISLKP